MRCLIFFFINIEVGPLIMTGKTVTIMRVDLFKSVTHRIRKSAGRSNVPFKSIK